MYSVTDRNSLEEAVQIHEQILKVKDSKFVPFILLGNKIDLENERKVSTSEGLEVAKKLNIPFLETSAKKRVNIDESFITLVKNTPRTGMDYKVYE